MDTEEGHVRIEEKGSPSRRLRELEEDVSSGDHRPFASGLSEVAQKELPEASALLDLSEDRLDDLVPEPVTAASTCAAAGS
jgi:hypothetical protein